MAVSYVRANSTNLPKVTNVMILEYVAESDKHNIAEIRGAKALMSSRDSYLNSAVGYVEVNRDQNRCLVRAKIVPEHRITNKNYTVTANIDENNERICDAVCADCAAAAGGCKHSLLLLFWLAKRTEEPSPTDIQCYWNKPRLLDARQERVTTNNIFKDTVTTVLEPKDVNVLARFEQECKNRNAMGGLVMSFVSERNSYNIFDMTLKYINQGRDLKNFNVYKQWMDSQINDNIIDEIRISTKGQAECGLWHDLRQGRITAYKIYDATRCKTDGSLVQQILGGYKVPETAAMTRGKKLEGQVIHKLEKGLNKKIQKTGIILINSLIGASPDGVCDECVIEIKCPYTPENMKYYVKNNTITERFKAQVQLQMKAANKKKALFCLADPEFETNKKIYIYWIHYDSDYTNHLISQALEFWKTYIFPKVIASAK